MYDLRLGLTPDLAFEECQNEKPCHNEIKNQQQISEETPSSGETLHSMENPNSVETVHSLETPNSAETPIIYEVVGLKEGGETEPIL